MPAEMVDAVIESVVEACKRECFEQGIHFDSTKLESMWRNNHKLLLKAKAAIAKADE